jgi:hypothetical protein
MRFTLDMRTNAHRAWCLTACCSRGGLYHSINRKPGQRISDLLGPGFAGQYFTAEAFGVFCVSASEAPCASVA